MLDDKGCSLGAAGVNELYALVSGRSGGFGGAEQRYSGFKALEEFLAGHFDEIEIDGDEELERREMALASAGLSYLDDGLPSEVDESNGEVASGRREVILDTEFIAIYW